MQPLHPGFTLVVSPLVALIHDQVTKLRAKSVPCTYLTSALSPVDFERIVLGNYDNEALLNSSDIQKPQVPFKILFVTPERVARSSVCHECHDYSFI